MTIAYRPRSIPAVGDPEGSIAKPVDRGEPHGPVHAPNGAFRPGAAGGSTGPLGITHDADALGDRERCDGQTVRTR